MYERAPRGWKKHYDFMLLDLICLEAAFIIAYFIRMGFGNPFASPTYREFGIVILLFDFVLLLFLDTLKNVLKRGYYKEFMKTLTHVIVLMLLISMYMFMIKESSSYSRIFFFVHGGIYFVLTLVVRILWKKYLLNKSGEIKGHSLLIMSSESRAPEVAEKVLNHNYQHYHVVGWVFHDGYKIGKMVEGIPVVATKDKVIEYVMGHWVDEVLVALPAYDEFPREIIDSLTAMGVTVHISLDKTADLPGLNQVVGTVGGISVISSSLNTMTARQAFAKRFLDIIIGICGCIATGILYIFLAPAIKRESPGPTFFSQTRIGKNGKPFKIYKFRSMYMDAEERKKELMAQNRIEDGLMFKMEFDPRVIGNRIDENGEQHTGIGELIRKYSLDEFPQFLNVLLGSMSAVGTRPPTVDEVEKYSKHHHARLATKPGITGMWQVSGRSDITDFEEVVRLDTQYINNWSLGLDIKILLRTLKVVLKKEGSM